MPVTLSCNRKNSKCNKKNCSSKSKCRWKWMVIKIWIIKVWIWIIKVSSKWTCNRMLGEILNHDHGREVRVSIKGRHCKKGWKIWNADRVRGDKKANTVTRTWLWIKLPLQRKVWCNENSKMNLVLLDLELCKDSTLRQEEDQVGVKNAQFR